MNAATSKMGSIQNRYICIASHTLFFSDIQVRLDHCEYEIVEQLDAHRRGDEDRGQLENAVGQQPDDEDQHSAGLPRIS